MTRDDDFIGQLEGYLDEYEGMTPLPDGVRSAVRRQLPTTKQVRLIWPIRRFSFMNTNFVRFGIAAAAAVLAVIIGFSYLSGRNVGGDPDASPSADPSLAAVPLPEGSIPAGRYVLTPPEAEATLDVALTVDDGWIGGGWYLYMGTSSNPSASITFWRASNVYGDSCDPDQTIPDPPVGPTVDDFVSALDAQANTDTSAPVEVTVGGYAGKRVDITVSDGDDCPDQEGFPVFVTFYGGAGPSIPRGPNRASLWILDVDGDWLVIFTFQDPTNAAATTMITDVIDSIDISVP